MTTVTLDIFSGRPNPAWELTEPQIAALAELSAAARPVQPQESDGLGYRGFVVTSNDPRLPPKVRIYRAPGVERFLMETAGDAIPRELRDALRDELG